MDVSRFRSMVLVAGLAAAAVLVVVLASQKCDLLARIEGLTIQLRDPHAGMYVPGVALPTVSGDSVLLGQAPSGQVQVLFVFSTRCRYCKASLPAWKGIAQEFSHNSQVAVVGISVDSLQLTRKYVVEHGLEFPIVSFDEGRLRALYRAGITPQILIVDGDGKVSYARIGAVSDPVVIDSIVEAVPVSIHELSNRLDR